MALLDSEIQRIKYELGWSLLSIHAEPYIGITQIFEQVVKPYTLSGASTTSSTSVVAAASPTAVTLTLASMTGIEVGQRVVVDVDDLQEAGTVRSVAGSTITVLLSKAHSGTYPVTVEGGESIIREILNNIRVIRSRLGGVQGTGALKAVDEIEWYEPKGGGSQFQMLSRQLEHWQEELASVIGIQSMRQMRQGGSQRLVNY